MEDVNINVPCGYRVEGQLVFDGVERDSGRNFLSQFENKTRKHF